MTQHTSCDSFSSFTLSDSSEIPAIYPQMFSDPEESIFNMLVSFC